VIQEPSQPTPTPNPPPRPRRTAGIRIGLSIAACLALAIPVASTLAASPSPSGPPSSAGTGASAAPGAANKPVAPGPGNVPAGPTGERGPKGPAKEGPGKSPITIRAINASQLSLATEDGWTRTVTATGATVITRAARRSPSRTSRSVTRSTSHKPATPMAPTRSPRSTSRPPRSGRGHGTRCEHHHDQDEGRHDAGDHGHQLDRLRRRPNTGSKSDVAVGSDIDAQGSKSGDTFTATTVKVKLPHIGGGVIAKTSDSITVKDPDGTTRTIHVTGSTTYQVKGQATGSLSDIAVGDQINAEGTLRADGSLDAVAIHSGPPKGERPPDAPAAPNARHPAPPPAEPRGGTPQRSTRTATPPVSPAGSLFARRRV